MSEEELREFLEYCDEMIDVCHIKGRRHWKAIRKEVEERLPVQDDIPEENSEKQVGVSEIDSDDEPERTTKMKKRIMYVEYKGDGLAGTARIGCVGYSKTGKSVYYDGRTLRSLKGGYKANYYDVKTGEAYWISGCKKRGEDTLYPGIVEIDEDVREEYWLDIRNQPENVQLNSFRTVGKYSKRRPR